MKVIDSFLEQTEGRNDVALYELAASSIFSITSHWLAVIPLEVKKGRQVRTSPTGETVGMTSKKKVPCHVPTVDFLRTCCSTKLISSLLASDFDHSSVLGNAKLPAYIINIQRELKWQQETYPYLTG